MVQLDHRLAARAARPALRLPQCEDGAVCVCAATVPAPDHLAFAVGARARATTGRRTLVCRPEPARERALDLRAEKAAAGRVRAVDALERPKFLRLFVEKLDKRGAQETMD